jgi:hypothetical protein
MKLLNENYTVKSLNNLLDNSALIGKKIPDPNRKGLIFKPTTHRAKSF